jgi:hypothetical protein
MPSAFSLPVLVPSALRAPAPVDLGRHSREAARCTAIQAKAFAVCSWARWVNREAFMRGVDGVALQ